MTSMTTMTSTLKQPAETNSAPRMIGSIELISLSASEWRVRNTALPEADGSSVLGVVQVIGDTFEVMQIGLPLARYYFSSLEDAVEYLVRTS
jgi:hypothetical protein